MESKRGSGFLIGRVFLKRTGLHPDQVRGQASLENALARTRQGPWFDDIRVADRLAAWRGAALGAGPADQGALSDFSRHRRHAAGLRAIGSVVDAGTRSGAGAVRGA